MQFVFVVWFLCKECLFGVCDCQCEVLLECLYVFEVCVFWFICEEEKCLIECIICISIYDELLYVGSLMCKNFGIYLYISFGVNEVCIVCGLQIYLVEQFGLCCKMCDIILVVICKCLENNFIIVYVLFDVYDLLGVVSFFFEFV